MADLDAQHRGVSNPGSYQWWLDVETVNSWESNTQNNRAVLEGMVAYFQGIGSKVGIYSTTRQWGQITGTVQSGPLYPLVNWIPGTRTLSQAKTNCGPASSLTGGGKVTVTQWTTSPADSDFSCP